MKMHKLAKRIDNLTGNSLSSMPVLVAAYNRARAALSPNPYSNVSQHQVRGFQMLLNPNLQHHTSILESHEEHVIDKLRATLSPGDVLYDVGANSGYSTLNAVTEGASVVAFEPEPEAYDLLLQNIELNSAESLVDALPIAIHDSPGEMELHRSVGGYQAQHSLLDSPRRQGGSVTVDVDTIDTITLDHPSPDGVKIDVEGAEAGVLRGMKETLSSHEPDVILEIHTSGDSRVGEINDVEDVLEPLWDAGYSIIELTETGERELDTAESLSSQHILART